MSWFKTNLVQVCVVAAVTCCTSGGVVRDGIAGVGQLHPEPPVYVLLHQRVDEKTAKSIKGHYGLHQVKALHVEGIKKGPAKRSKNINKIK